MIDVYLTDDINLKQYTFDKYGEITATTVTALKGRIEYKTQLVRNFAGEQVVAGSNVLIKNRTITHADKIEFEGTDHVIIGIDIIQDFGYQFLRLNIA
jgi:hypothetical protein